MAIILGIDAAWTITQPSGVALVDTDRGTCLAVAPSYASFLDMLQHGIEVPWERKHTGGEPPVSQLLSASHEKAQSPVDVVAIDMPVATVAISGRRAADNAVSREYGGRWCAAHTPSVARPGELGVRLTHAFESHGYPVATTNTHAGTPNRLVEVYPHPALLALLHRNQRVPYKVSKIRKYWPNDPPAKRRTKLMTEFRSIERGLTAQLGPLPFSIPSSTDISTKAIKAYEDALDAAISAWVGCLYMQDMAVPLGDDTAAIWCPRASLRSASDQTPATRA